MTFDILRKRVEQLEDQVRPSRIVTWADLVRYATTENPEPAELSPELATLIQSAQDGGPHEH